MGKFIDITGNKYGELTVVALSGTKIRNRPAWECVCDCGKTRVVGGDSLKNADVTTCGNHKSKRQIAGVKQTGYNNRKYKKEEDTNSRLYTIWRAVHHRCYSESHEAYPRYGGAGIRMCDEWLSYSNFILWAGKTGYAADLTIDRIDNYKGYYPENCRWATTKAQANNRKYNVRFDAFGENKTVTEWALDGRCKVNANSLRKRIHAGHPGEAALTYSEYDMRSKGRVALLKAKKDKGAGSNNRTGDIN